MPTGPATAPRAPGVDTEHGHPDYAPLQLVDHLAEFEHAVPRHGVPIGPSEPRPFLWAAIVAVVAVIVAGVAVGYRVANDHQAAASSVVLGHAHAFPQTDTAYHPQMRHHVEVYKRPDPNLPPVPPGPVKKFRVVVTQHITRVSQDAQPMEVWSFGVNGQFLSGTGASPPIVVNQGDRVEATFVNGDTKSMHVSLPHSLDLHAAAADPSRAFVTLGPGKGTKVTFTAGNPGVFMYHCVSAPALLHVGSGMAGMFVVKPRNLPPVDRELWLTQQEFYPSPSGHAPDYAAMQAKKPRVIAFNGYADQYIRQPIKVRKGERLRIYLLNAGASHWEAFHVIGAVFDRTTIEGVEGHDAQTVSLAPSQGGWVDLTLNQDGSYPFVTHDFADVEKGPDGALQTSGAKGPIMQH